MLAGVTPGFHQAVNRGHGYVACAARLAPGKVKRHHHTSLEQPHGGYSLFSQVIDTRELAIMIE